MNPSFAEFARHYGLAVIPARPRKPKDKPKVENGVQQVERWVLAPLRDRTFFSLDELNEEVARLVEDLNDRPMKGPGASRRELFEQIDRPAMAPLPEGAYRFARWKRFKLGPDYHAEFEGHRYSVPHVLVGKRLDLRITADTVEVFEGELRVCTHARSLSRLGFTTVPGHMPDYHREFAAWTPERLESWARQTGPSVGALAHRILTVKVHPEQSFRSCFGLVSLAKRYSPERLEAACSRAFYYGAFTYTNVKTILEKGLDSEPIPNEPLLTAVEHDNVRGPEYFGGGRSLCAS